MWELGKPRPGSKEKWTHSNGVIILFSNNNCFGVMVPNQTTHRILLIEVDYEGKRFKADWFDALNFYRDSLDVDLDRCMVRVKEGNTVLAELGNQPQGHLYQPWMVRQGEQAYETENYISVPPALHLTDEVGARWTLGFLTAPRELSPQGEFAFNVLRDGFDVGETASRLEIRNGQVRIFTRKGWKTWTGREFSSAKTVSS